MTAPQAKARTFSCGCAMLLLGGAVMDCGMPWFAFTCALVACAFWVVCIEIKA